MATTRDLNLEKKYVDQFFQAQGRAPSSPEDWKSIHSASYGAELPQELSSLPMYGTDSAQGTSVPGAPTSGTGLNYQGADISDTALTNARNDALSYNTTGFLDKVRDRLQKKFKPETETLGLGTFSATLGALDPSGVMAGINEKSGQFRRKGALALQALSTANDIYSEQAQKAYDKLNLLEGYRSAYEAEQKEVESQMQSLALEIAQTGKPIPNEILDMLPPAQRAAYEALPSIFASTGLGESVYGDYSSSKNGWSGDELMIEQGSGNAFECGYWARTRGDYAGGAPMGNSFKEKTNWVNKYGTQGTAGLGVGDLVITNGSDVSASGSPLATGHALIVGAMDAQGNIYAYEANAKGDKAVTFGRWVDPNSIYGYVSGNMNPGEMERMQSYAMSYNPAGKGKPEQTETTSELDIYAQKYKDGGVSISELTAKFGKDGKDKILAKAAELTKTPKAGSTDNKTLIQEAFKDLLANYRGADGFVDTARYKEVRENVKLNAPDLLSWFDSTYPVEEYINPDDESAEDLLYR